MKISRPHYLARCAAVALPLAVLPFAAGAQTPTAQNASGSNNSWLPYTTNGYIGVNLGESRFDNENCVFGFSCNDKSDDLAGKIYVGGMFNPHFGVEVGYVNVGKQKLNGGDRKAQGANVSLVGVIPVERFSFFGKVGSTYSWTETSATAGPTGDKDGWGLSYGAGVGFDMTPQTQLVLEWDRNRIDFAGANDTDVDLYTAGVKFRF